MERKEQCTIMVVHRLLCRDPNHKSLAKVLNIYRVQYLVIIEYTGLITRKRCQSLQFVSIALPMCPLTHASLLLHSCAHLHLSALLQGQVACTTLVARR